MINIPAIDNLVEIHNSNNTVVYEGFDTTANKQVAVKVLKDEFPSLRSIAKFNEEFEITHNLEITGVRKAYAKQKIQNKHILLLDYIEGKSLRSLIDTEKLTVEAFLNIAIKTTKVLSELHQNGVIHKDINPRNILIIPTGDIKIIDFGISTQVKRQTQQLESPDALEGTLAYISPEQTGRMNRSVDYRTDLYSLGITFYEMLTGKLPFKADDSMEFIHSHMAKKPVSLIYKNSNIPIVISNIVDKLLAKNAEERYQSAEGLRYDLQKCLDLLESEGEITHFDIARNDWTNQFQIPEKLYGRDQEAQALLEAFMRVSAGSCELMLVAGYSGIGKTALVNEVHKPVTEKKGYFITGKFDQFQRDIPFSAIIQALKDFISQLLTEPESNINRWKRIILNVLGTNGKVITEVIPSLELIIGEQPDIPELGPTETQNRFNMVFQDFIRGISRKEHPLVMFIDDWQWADVASLNLLKLLMTDEANKYLLMIGAYRDNEVDVTHPFSRSLADLKKEKAFVINQIDMKPLIESNIVELVEDTLGASTGNIPELARIIFQKARGNPFFTAQFFETLYDENLLVFDRTQRVWRWSISDIQQMQITDNVIELMVGKIKKLKESTQTEMKLAACIGNEFDLRTLSYIRGKNQKTVLDNLWEAVDEGLILPLSENYRAVDESTEDDLKVYFKFLHDRVHQAAFTMIEQSVREQTNLEIGRLAFRNNSEEYISEWICDIANYYNSGANLVEDENEILQLVTINHRAGLKAKRSTAYEAALRYFQTGIDNLLRAYDWNNQYELAFNLTKNFAECCYLLTRFDAAEAAFSQLLMNSKTVTEKGEILIMMSSLYSNTLKFEDALATCKKAVSQLGFDVPDGQEATQKAFAAELEKIESLRQEKGYQDMGDLVHAEPIKDQNTLYALNACLQGWASAYMCNDFDTVFWLAAKITSISLEFGVAPESAYGVLAQGIYLSNVTGDYNQGYEYGKTGLAINERFNDMSLKTPINHLMGTFVGFWKLPLRENFQFFKQAYESGMITGNYTYTGYAHAVKTRHAYFMGEPLQELAEECNRSVTVLSKIKMESMIALMSPNYALIKCLLGETESATTIDCDIFNEKTYLENVGQIPIYLAVLYPLKSRMFFYAKEYQKGIENYELAVPNMVALFGTIWNVFHNLNGSLNLAGLCHEQLNPAHLDKIKENQTQMKVWADTCPNNFMHQYILIEAEVANLEGNYLEAMDFYDKAISLAQENNFIDDEALANELAGEFYIKIQKKHIAALYMKRAHYAYSMWGAKTKMEDLEHTYPLLLERTNLTYTIESTQTVSPMTTNQTIASTTHLGGSLDLNTLLKATQAITGEIKLENLLDKLLRIVAENAGADQVYLVLNNKKEFRIEASYSIDEKESSVLQSIPLDEETDDLPTGIINYALRSRKDVILNDASKEGQFQHNAYVEKYAPKSVLAGLIWKRGDIRAVLYLENKQTSGVFTAKRVELLSMLSSQIVISIDNALLYQNTENLVEERTIELREKNKRITDSIMYAETIQGAILPDKEDFESFFADHFVIYRPKDIVSGDFYWLNEVNGSAVLACIDCTGHGVPGAFMSMIGNTLLDEIVIQKQHTDPAAILSLLHKNIRTALKQESGQNTDGMDMSICVFTKTGEGKYRLDFAGAKRAIWVTKDREFEVVTGDRKSIGGFQKEVERKFNTKTLELSSGDMVYQFTDGFADQNNPDMKRFGSKRLRQLISSYTKIPLPKQRELLENNFDVFRAGEPQRDDITLMAIQL